MAESVVVIKKLLQTQTGDHREIIIHMSKLVDSITVPAARAAILWVLGEYSSRVPKIAPDVLRKMAKTFPSEDPEVKMQILNLALKLCITNPEQTRLLSQYVFNLAKYDQNYDIRDRARFMRAFIFPTAGQEDNFLIKEAKRIFLATKPAPIIESKFKDREVFQLGSLSHFLNSKTSGYRDLPEFPNVAPDPSVRNVEPPKAAVNPWAPTSTTDKKKSKNKKKEQESFYTSDSEESSSDDESDTSSSDEDDSESSSSLESEVEVPKQTNGPKKTKPKESSSEEEDTDSSSESSSEEEDHNKPSQPPTKNLDLLLDLDVQGSAPVLAPVIGTLEAKAIPGTEDIEEATAIFVPTKPRELLNKMTTGGLQLSYRYTRSPYLYSAKMANLELTITNLGDDDISDVKIGAKHLPPGLAVHEFPAVSCICVKANAIVNLGVDFNDTMQSAKFDIIASGRCFTVRFSVLIHEAGSCP